MRQEYESETARGLPAHITLLYPFKPPENLHAGVLDDLNEFFANQSAIDFELRRVETFPAGVVYLAPEPAAAFLKLIHRLARKYPEHPPYGGVYETIVPHLSVAKSADLELQARLRAAVSPQLPVAASAHEVWLMEDRDDGWKLRCVFPLARLQGGEAAGDDPRSCARPG